MSAAKDLNPTPAMTPAQHLRAAEHLLSELSFESDGMPAVRWRGKFYDALTNGYGPIADSLEVRAHLHVRIAQAQAGLPQTSASAAIQGRGEAITDHETLSSQLAFNRFGFPSADYGKTHTDQTGAEWVYVRPEDDASEAVWRRTDLAAPPNVSVGVEEARWLLECVKASFEEGWTPQVGDRESNPHDTDGLVARLAEVAGVELSDVLAE